MKKLILALAICFGLTAYGSNEVKRESTAKVEQVQPQKTGQAEITVHLLKLKILKC